MSNRRVRRTRAHLDDLISGRPATHDPVAGLLAAAAAPAQPGELAGADSAVAAFAARPPDAEPEPERPAARDGVARRSVATKVIIVAAGVVATGGVAFAAVTSDDAASLRPQAVIDAGSAAPGDSSVTGSGAAGASAASRPASADPGATSRRGPRHTAISPSLRGLCMAWLAHPREVATMSGNPAFGVLITAAGGTDAVNRYCRTLLATAQPGHPAHPSQAQNTKSRPGRTAQPSHPAHPSQAQNTKSRPGRTAQPSHPAPPD